MSDTARLKIKLGQVEVEYEGDSAFLKTGLLATFKDILELQQNDSSYGSLVNTDPPSLTNIGAVNTTLATLSTDTIANLLKVNDGTELIVAAAAHLCFAKGKQTFNRQELVAEMKNAPGHYKQTYHKNLGSYLNTLKKNDRLRLASASPEIFALSNNEKQTLENKLA